MENDKIKSIFLDYIVTVDFMRRKDAHEYLTHTIILNILTHLYIYDKILLNKRKFDIIRI